MSTYLEPFQEAQAPYKKALIQLGETHPQVVVMGADLANSTEIDGFQAKYPQRFYNFGSAEQNMVNAAVGMSFEGSIPFIHSFGVFLTRRAYEQVCIQVSMQAANVKLVGVIPGLTSRLGPTHQAVDDLGLMRVLPNMTVIDPADATEIEQLVPIIANHPGPVYTRMMRREVPRILDPAQYRFQLGKAQLIRAGTDFGIISTGLMLQHALEASSVLSQRGIHVGILHVPTLKPLDLTTILEFSRETKHLMTVENHWIAGGLGTVVAEALVEHAPKPLIRMGLADSFAAPGTPDYLFDQFGFSTNHIVNRIEKVLSR